MRYLLFLIPFLASCAQAPRRIQYQDYAIVIERSQWAIDKFCQVDHWDDGSRPRWNEHATACWDPVLREIHTLNTCSGARALTHELAHKEGVADPSKDGFDWDD